MTRPDDIPAIVRQRFDYDPASGEFIWKSRPVTEFPSARIAKNWNTRFAGKPAFASRSDDGYSQVELLLGGKRVRVFGHTAAFAYVAGRLPSAEIDHRNRIRDDNRFANLREATRAENNRNTVKRGRYLTGARPRGRKWEARICHDRKLMHIGVFDTEKEAHQAYLGEARRLHGDFAVAQGVA